MHPSPNINKQQPLILQFGTSRFLQAHVDYFVGHSLENADSKAPILVVQSSDSPVGHARVTAMNSCTSYPVRIQGIQDGVVINRQEHISAICGALQANLDWQLIVTVFCDQVTHVVSNTADQGYLLIDRDSLSSPVPKSFPAKLLVLLEARFKRNANPVTIMPCELVANNGDVLKALVLSLAQRWQLGEEFLHWLANDCLWVNSLVDRIVSESIEPLGAVAEPYALWAIENQPRLVLPCHHPAIRLVDDLLPLETLKLSVLNLSHTFLVDLWQQQSNSKVQTVVEAMQDPYLRGQLDQVLRDEVLPVLEAMQLGEDVEAYIASVMERFLNPFLQHQLVDIAQNHGVKVERRILPLLQQGAKLLPLLAMPQLRAVLSRNGLSDKVDQ
ncbi:MAG: mannitol dehydrogenase family protein [Oceanospirillaceae bacterium]|nr:mannitol dehydrogenase family protein [Oceanospirillaceae bacterium]